MSSLVWLGLAAILVGVVALTRTGPKHGKPVQNTRLMGMARYVLVLGIIACAAVGVFGALRR
jgi:drug/metabolite transporter (DMT)-like permease